jgi:hypothetical protein
MKSNLSAVGWPSFWGLLKIEIAAHLMQLRMLALFLLIPVVSQFLVTGTLSSITGPPYDFTLPNNEIYFLVYLPMFFAAVFGIGPVGRMSGQSLDFILTRAVSRKAIFRAKIAVYLICVATPLLISIVSSTFQSETVLQRFPHYPEHSHPLAERQDIYLKSFPGSYETTLAPNNLGISEGRVHIPGGNIWLSFWSAWRLLLLAFIVQALGVWTMRRQKLYGFLMVAPFALVVVKLWLDPANVWMNDAFLFFHGHWPLLWLGLLIFAARVQHYGERQFQKIEIL